MQLAFISDVHANYEALQALDDILTAADKVVCLGDLTGYYCQVNEVITYMRRLDACCVMGNHDYYVLHGCPPQFGAAVQFGVAFAQGTLSLDNRAWLAQLPLSWGGIIGGRKCLCVHGSPWRPLEDYLYADSPLLEQLAAFDYDVIAFGQTHRSLQRLGHRPYLLNPGAVGQSRDVDTRAHACAVVLETETLSLTTVARSYDAARVIELARQHGAGEWITKHLR